MGSFKKINRTLLKGVFVVALPLMLVFFMKQPIETRLALAQIRFTKELKRVQETEIFYAFCRKHEVSLKRLLAQKKKQQFLTFEALGAEFKKLGKNSGIENLVIKMIVPKKKLASEAQRRLELIFKASNEKACFSFIAACWESFPGLFFPQKLVLCPFPSGNGQAVSGKYLLNFQKNFSP
ncbi:MAG: hypothetical protein K2P90_03660 [Holosporales bacterium]|jgi:hypothetical protein|nr:hypothetical protein [Holosporales bacterium]